ncbi:cyclic GMP-AMP synthase-like [Colletes gigas]|uniref:cyclic GMP-AMP synthase-like n=1 Tax=Colletes gigas TaxID=935657 RepID=UPI001C9B7146|nr:cyclic GMP-AMP synthase-like [Colletes gigas]
MDETQLKKYLSDNTVFNLTNKMFISLESGNVKRYKACMSLVVEALIQEMKKEDTLFEKMYRNIIYCGSVFKQTKVSKLDEFDLNINLKLPIDYNNISLYSNQPAFITIYIKNYSPTDTIFPKCNLTRSERKSLYTFIDDGYVNPHKFRQWTERILSKVMNKLQKYEDKYILHLPANRTNILFKIRKSGPAFTLILTMPETNEDISIDLVPALCFQNCKINGSNIKINKIENCQHKAWFAIPLPSINYHFEINENLQWRTSFYYQEKEILAKLGNVKPVIRQMKKLRDVQKWKNVASYFIETLFLHISDQRSQEGLNKMSSTLLFFYMLQELHYAFMEHRIEYFWDAKYNLLQKIGRLEMDNMAHRLSNVIKNIEKRITSDPFIIASYVLTENELKMLKEKYNKMQNETCGKYYRKSML